MSSYALSNGNPLDFIIQPAQTAGLLDWPYTQWTKTFSPFPIVSSMNAAQMSRYCRRFTLQLSILLQISLASILEMNLPVNLRPSSSKRREGGRRRNEKAQKEESR
mmetsp:Transcript_14656/g.18724  ORF Transcript_14656/g.18724 Transcript_14656/m.18724 type:complete len:106 (+) Transcript_14656:694-1011(+)